MAVTSDPPSEGFRLGMLLYDTRYRSLTIQVVALMGFMLGVGWLASNALANLAALGKPLGFKFLWDPAGYDINQRLIEYTSQSPHWKAAVVGILNTLLVAFLGCILATILGIETLPAPRAFRGENPEASMFLWDSVALTNRGWYTPAPTFQDGSWLVVAVFLASIVGVFLFGRWAKARQEQTGDILPTFWIKLGLLIVPTLLFFFIMGRPIGLEYPELKGFNFKGGIYMRNSLIALWLALSLYTAAFIAEIVRAGILSVSKGQTEAAFALGIKPKWTMNLIILPQALRVIIPPLISNYLNLTKNSSLAIAVGYMDVTGTLSDHFAFDLGGDERL